MHRYVVQTKFTVSGERGIFVNSTKELSEDQIRKFAQVVIDTGSDAEYNAIDVDGVKVAKVEAYGDDFEGECFDWDSLKETIDYVENN